MNNTFNHFHGIPDYVKFPSFMRIAVYTHTDGTDSRENWFTMLTNVVEMRNISHYEMNRLHRIIENGVLFRWLQIKKAPVEHFIALKITFEKENKRSPKWIIEIEGASSTGEFGLNYLIH